MDLVFETLRRFFLAQDPHQTYLIAYSGGLDSHVLLHACSVLRETIPLHFRAMYVNHHLSPHSDSWAAHCKKTCEALTMDFLEKNIFLNKNDQSLEAVAREARYAAFAEVMKKNDILLTAHHEEDQAETVLLQLMRGAGPKGLSAMPVIKTFAQGSHARPLLFISRETLKKYAEFYHLQWIEDESNDNTSFTRNFLRLEVLPILKKRWPSVTKTLGRVASHCAEAQILLEELAENDLKIVSKQGIVIDQLLKLSSERQRQVLRLWFKQLQFPLPSVAKMQQIQNYFLSANHDKTPHLIWGPVELRRFQNMLYAMPRLRPHKKEATYLWNLSETLLIPEVGLLQAIRHVGGGVSANINQVEVRFRQGGERCQLPGRRSRHELKKLFQEWQVPPWERDRMPLLFLKDQLIGVPGFFIDASVAAKQGEEGLSIFYSKINQP